MLRFKSLLRGKEISVYRGYSTYLVCFQFEISQRLRELLRRLVTLKTLYSQVCLSIQPRVEMISS